MTPDEFRRHGHELIDWIAEYLDDIARQRIVPDIEPGDVRAQLPATPPTAPEPWSAVFGDFEQIIVPNVAHWQHPGWFAYFPGNTSYASILGELMAAGLGVNAMSWVTSPAATELETLMVDWMRELLDLPVRFASSSAVPASDGGGAIQGSASEATLVAILSARWRATGGRVNLDGDTTRLVAYCTAQSHSSIEKGLRVAGIGTEQIRVIAHDDNFAMRPEALREAIAADQAAGLVPFIVCATCGTTSSMAFDPIDAIVDIAQPANIWVHVDGAMSGIAALAPEFRWVNDGLDRVDSYCTNPHKWMGVNFDCTLYYTADRASLLGALSILPEYLRSAAAASGAAIDYRDWQIPLGRRFRALKLWTTLRLDGVDAIVERLRRDVAVTQEFAGWVNADARFTLVAPHPLNLVCLRVASDTPETGDELTEALINAVNGGGEFLVTRTVLDGRVAMRVSIGARTTEQVDVANFWKALTELV